MNFLFLIGIFIGYLFLNFDKMVVERSELKKAWEEANMQIERRFDVILDLVNILLEIDLKEKNYLDNIIQARNSYLIANSNSEIIKANRRLNINLKKLFDALKNYKYLGENIIFNNTLEKFIKIDKRLINKFKAYNLRVKKYNNYIKMGPNRFYSGLFGFTQKKYLERDMLELILKI